MSALHQRSEESQAPWPERVFRYGGWALSLLGAAFVVRILVVEWSEVAEAISSVSGWWFVLALGFGASALILVALSWQVFLELIHVRYPARTVLRWFFLGELGKYVPGGVWAVVGRSEMAVRDGVPRRAAYEATLVSLMTTYGLAGLGGTVLFMLQGERGVWGPSSWYWLALLVFGLTVGMVALIFLARSTPALLSRIVAVRSHGVRPWAMILGANALFWLGVGLSVWALARGLGLEASFLSLVGATSLAWFVGFVVVPAPSGLGVREAVFLWLMPGEATGAIAALVVLSRATFIAIDILLAVSAMLSTYVVRRKGGNR